ncbi:MAG: 4a-hydroxytetrahydrobiopterin dehydratase [Acidobacteriota bacterium]|nr:MAG: 4a-hydroxytetrahydrobiopterin dehydratase [Acidobacteriota bacterium]
MHQDRQARMKLSDDEVQEELKALNHWEIVEGKLHREFKFENFIEAFAFMTKLSMVAERLNHHPEWTNVYNKVTMWLTTHDVDGISRSDFDLAQAANRYYGY